MNRRPFVVAIAALIAMVALPGTALAGGDVSNGSFEDGDFAEQIAGAHEIQRQAATVRRTGFDPDLAAADPEQGVAVIALLEQHLADPELLGVAKPGDSL